MADIKLPESLQDLSETGEFAKLQAQCKQAAVMAATGATKSAMASALGMPPSKIVRLLANPITLRYLQEIGDDALAQIKTVIRKKAVELTQKSFAVIEHHLEKKNLQAALAVIKLASGEENMDDGPANISIVLPGAMAKTERIIEVKPNGELQNKD